MKEKILEALRELGFTPEPVDEVGYKFCYERMTLLFMNPNDDETYLSIALPCVYDTDDGDAATMASLIEQTNEDIKYVKAYRLADAAWLAYERELMGDDDLVKTLRLMILRLEHALRYFGKKREELSEE